MSSDCVRGRAQSVVVPFVCLLASICISAVATHAQTALPRQLTIIHPDDDAFDQLVRENYPGLQDIDGYQATRPYLVLLRNDTRYNVRAYAVAWDIESPGIVNRAMNQFIQRDRIKATALPFAPGQLRLIAPLLNVGPGDWGLQQQTIKSLMPRWSSQFPYSATNIKSIKATVDAVIYEDGGYTGRDRFLLLTEYQCIRNAEHEVAEAVLKMMDTKSPVADIVAMLERDIQAGREASARTSRRDPDAICALYRAEEAEGLLLQYRRGGEESLMTKAWARTQRPRENVQRISPD